IGSYGKVPASAVSPLTSSFPWKGAEGVPCIYDMFVVRETGSNLLGSAPNLSAALGDSIRLGSLYFTLTGSGNACNNGQPVRLAGGNGEFYLGEDLLHFHHTAQNTIMAYSWGWGDTVRTPSDCELDLLRAIGWSLPSVGLTELEKNGPVVFP